MLYACVRGVMDVVFSVCIVRHGAEMLVYVKPECFVMQMLCFGCLLWQSCITSRWLMLVNDVRGDHMEEAYSIAVLMTAL